MFRIRPAADVRKEVEDYDFIFRLDVINEEEVARVVEIRKDQRRKDCYIWGSLPDDLIQLLLDNNYKIRMSKKYRNNQETEGEICTRISWSHA